MEIQAKEGYNTYGIYQGGISPMVNTFQAVPGLVSNIVSDPVSPSSIVDGQLNSTLQQEAGTIFTGKQNFTDNTAGYRLGFDTDGVAKFLIGNSSNSLYWNGSTLVINGSITATTGAIGGFNIGSDYIRDAANSFGLASTVTGGNDVRFWAGDTFANRATAPLRLYEDGSIIGTNATFTGALFATSGWIGSATALIYESQGINTGITGFIRGGQTSYNTGTGYFLGYDAGQYKLSIGNTTNFLTWNGTTLEVAGTFNLGGTQITVSAIADVYTALATVEAAGGGKVYVDNGTYTLTADISVPSGVTLEGVSRDGVIFDCDGTYKVQVTGSNAYNTGTVTINNGDTTVVGSGTTFTSAMVGRYILLDGLWYEITAFTDTTHITITEYNGGDLAGSTYTIAEVNFTGVLRKLTVTNATGSGVKVQYAQESFLDDIVVYDCGTGLDLDQAVYPRIIAVSNSNGVNLNMNECYGWYVDFSDFSLSTSGAGVVMTNNSFATFFNTFVGDCFGNGISMTNCEAITFLSASISGNGGNGVELISGCDTNQFVACDSSFNAGDGYKLTATSDNNILSSFGCTDNGGYGVNIAASSCDNNQIIAPAFSNNSSGNINDNGTNTTILPQEIGADVQTFLSSGTWTKPSQGTMVLIQAWGGGGSGGSTTTASPGGGGGGGGAYSEVFLPIASLGSTETITIGDGGAAVSGNSNGNPGGNTTVGSLLTAYGGGAGAGAGGQEAGGGGGGIRSAGANGTSNGGNGGSPAGGAGGNGGPGGNSAFGGGGGGDTGGQAGGESTYGGGGGGGEGNSVGGNSFYGGGGGGGGHSVATTGGTSIYGGNGGNGGDGTPAPTAGAVPGGGGGGAENNVASGAGGKGKVMITTF